MPPLAPAIPGMPAQATITLDCDSADQAKAVEAALAPELGSDVPGSRATLERQGTTLTLRLAAEDAGALRAALNGHLRWMRLSLDVHRLARL